MIPIKICPHCFLVHPSARRICCGCNWEFYPSKAKGSDDMPAAKQAGKDGQ